MKTCRSNFLLAALAALLFSVPLSAQKDAPIDSTGMPGDNFSLEGALDLFKKAESPEEFEKLLNAENNKVNNLDLNEDGEVDYIRVIDNMEGDVHAIVLQVPVSETESQDIAVIEIEKTGAEDAMLQIIGDEDVYGEQVIVEPFDMEMKEKGKGPSADLGMAAVVVNVWVWPSVRFVYRPGYSVWVSPWRWHNYPTWWRPWRPRPFHAFYVGVRPYRAHYHPATTHRVVVAHKVYAPRRTHSTVVRTRTTTIKGRGGRSVTHTTRTATAKGKNGGSVTAKRSSTKVQGRNGGGAKRTTTTVKRKRGGN